MKNKTIIFLMTVFASAMFFSCSDDEETTPAKVSASASGTWTDPRDGNEYGWVRYGDTDWMTTNMKYNVEGSTVYEDYDNRYTVTQENLAKYGRLYNYQEALAACPEGWRIPTDADWQKLEQHLGMSASEANGLDWRGNIARSMLTLKGDTCDLGLQLGGYYTDHTIMGSSGWRFMGVYAFYWTSTQDTSKDGQYYFYRKLTYAKNSVYRQSMEPEEQYLSVRCVRDAQ
jgi:uncharacterized protein (TIGR02145 family)